ncbi:MAG: hypothetical protein H6835_08505 [Planctomycetes bacterium]|nr:hypothetical protein [Planctomycetota bacterium]
MEKRDAVFLLALLGAGGYATWAHWDTISARLGLDEFEPGGIKAVSLAKNGFDFEAGTANWQYLQTRADQDEIELPHDAWTAQSAGDNRFVVTARWREHDLEQRREFDVDIVTCAVAYRGEDPAPPR